MIDLITLDECNAEPKAELIDALAKITFNAFADTAPTWLPTLEHARAQVLSAAAGDGQARVAMAGERAVGWIGLKPGKRVWEIHPIAVDPAQQGLGVGRLLVDAAVTSAREADALTLFASTSDEIGSTSLFEADLFDAPWQAMRDLRVTGPSPVSFWQKVGFTVVGVLPDAEGTGKPSIQLARTLA